MSKNYLTPLCLAANKNTVRKGFAYTSRGYIIPCCWLDTQSADEDLTNLGMYDEELKLANNDSVEQIINSNQWRNFIRIISEDQEKAPVKCKKWCGK